jgi:hypothetical protein
LIEVKGVGPGGALPPEDMERERLKEIKTRLGKVAFLTALGKDARVFKMSSGISRAEGVLKWIEGVFGQEKWKDS